VQFLHRLISDVFLLAKRVRQISPNCCQVFPDNCGTIGI
jgi:hypothetical protein